MKRRCSVGVSSATVFGVFVCFGVLRAQHGGSRARGLADAGWSARAAAGAVGEKDMIAGAVALEPREAPVPTSRNHPNMRRRAAMNSAGDAVKGKELFASGVAKCSVCHKVQGQGGDAGPDLSLVAGKLDRTHLIESVLDPSAQILEGFRTTVVALRDGRVMQGIVTSESPGGFLLIDATNQKTAIASGDIVERKTIPVSLMPSDLTASFSPAEFTDLIAYLDTLRTGRKLSPGEGISGAVTLPAGFVVEPVATGLTGCTAMEVARDGRKRARMSKAPLGQV
jgi:putative heme-binding domain-containing protein